MKFPAKHLGFPPVFCQNNASKLEMSVSCLFTFSSAVCLLFSAVCLEFEFSRRNLGFPSVFCQNNASKLELSVSCLFTFSAVCLHFHQLFCQLFVYNLNFRAKNLVFPWLFCHYRCFSTLIVKWEHFNFLPFCSELFRIHISNSVVLWESEEVAWFCSELFRNWEVKGLKSNVKFIGRTG